MLPALPEANAVDDAIDGVIAKIRMHRLNSRMKLSRRQWPFPLQEIFDCTLERGRHRAAANSKTNELILSFMKPSLELALTGLRNRCLLRPKGTYKFLADLGIRLKLRSINDGAETCIRGDVAADQLHFVRSIRLDSILVIAEESTGGSGRDDCDSQIRDVNLGVNSREVANPKDARDVEEA